MLAMLFCKAAFEPWPISIIAITAPTPMITPRAVKTDRMVLRCRAPSAVRSVGGKSADAAQWDGFGGASPKPLPGGGGSLFGDGRVSGSARVRTTISSPSRGAAASGARGAAAPANAGTGAASESGQSSSAPRARVSSLSTSPSQSRIVRRANLATLGSWVTRITVIPSALSCWNICRISTLVCESRLPVGSSARTSEGRFTSARPMATRCCCPPDICDGSWWIRSASPTRSNSISAKRRDSPTEGRRGA
jgi:hypothetical protein